MYRSASQTDAHTARQDEMSLQSTAQMCSEMQSLVGLSTSRPRKRDSYRTPFLLSTSVPCISPGPKRALVQLKIDAMFAAPGLAAKKDPERRGVQPAAGISDGAQQCTGPSTKADRGMDVDAGGGASVDVHVGDQAAEGEGQAACYACRSGLGTEGGDILCSFCDRAACQGCWQKCFTCEIPHCSLCLAADYSSQFECYFCPPCYQERRLELR